MADSQSLGEIWVSIIADTAKLDSGLNKANQSVDTFGKKGKTAAKNTDTLQKGFDKTGKSSTDTSKKVDKLKKSVDDESKQAKTASKSNKDDADSIEEVGKKAEDSTSLVKGLKTALGYLGVGFGVAALVGAFKDFADSVITINSGISDMKNSLGTSMGATVSTETQKQIIAEITESNRGLGVFGEEYKEVLNGLVIDTTKNFSEATKTTQKAFVEQMIALANFGPENGVTDARKLGDDLYTLSKKWGMSAEETIKFSDYMLRTSQDTGIGIEDLTTNLLNFSDTAKRLGKDIYQSTDLMASAYHNRNLDYLMSGWNDTGFNNLYDRFSDKLKTQYEAALEEGTTSVMNDEELSSYISGSFNKIISEALTKAVQGVDEDELTSWIATQLGVSDRTVRKSVKALIESVANDTTSRTMRDTNVTAESQLAITGYTQATKDAYNQYVNPDLVLANEQLAKQTDLVQDIKNNAAKNSPLGAAATVFNNIPILGDLAIRANLLGYKIFGNQQYSEENMQLMFDTEALADGIEKGLSRVALSELFVRTLNDSKNLTEDGKGLPEITVDSFISIDGKMVKIKDYVENLDDLAKLLPDTEELGIPEDALESYNALDKTLIDGDTGLIPDVNTLSQSLTDGAINIESNIIPSNDGLAGSLHRVADGYRDIAAAKREAGM